MDPIESWVDPQEVRRLAEALMTPASRAQNSSEDATYSQGFVGFAETPQQAPMMNAAPTASPQPSPSAVVALNGDTSLHQQLSSLRQTISSRIPFLGMFALNVDASVAFDDGDHQHLYFAAQNWAKALLASPVAQQQLQLRVGSIDFLSLMALPTARGTVVLAFLVNRALTVDEVAAVTEMAATYLISASS